MKSTTITIDSDKIASINERLTKIADQQDTMTVQDQYLELCKQELALKARLKDIKDSKKILEEQFAISGNQVSFNFE